MSTSIKSRLRGSTGAKVLLVFAVVCFCAVDALSQSDGPAKARAGSRPAYIRMAAGSGFSSFRDFATSPLFYSGAPIYTSLAHIDRDEKRESHFSVSYAFGTYDSDYNKQKLSSAVNTFSVHYLELFEVGKISSSKLNIKVGGQFSTTAIHRKNTDLFNNSEGFDIIATLFGSAKVTLDLSRTEARSKRFLFIKYRALERRRALSCTMNVGLVNTSYRNGFAYTSPSAPVNRDDFFAGYQLAIFRGYRWNSTVDYTWYLQNKNAVQVSYVWDAYSTGGHHDNFDMSAHLLRLSLLFALK